MRKKRVRKLASLSKGDYGFKRARSYHGGQIMKKFDPSAPLENLPFRLYRRKRLAKTLNRRRDITKNVWKKG